MIYTDLGHILEQQDDIDTILSDRFLCTDNLEIYFDLRYNKITQKITLTKQPKKYSNILNYFKTKTTILQRQL